LGEFLKELDLTEGRATGVPTMQRHLEQNGSPRARIETDDERSFFMLEIPCHPDFLSNSEEADSDKSQDTSNMLPFLHAVVQGILAADLSDPSNVSQVVSQVKEESSNVENQKDTINEQILSQVVSQVVSQVKNTDLSDLSLMVEAAYLMQTPHTMKELMSAFNLTNRGRVKSKCLDPLLSCGLIEMTIPSKPNSRLQQYRLVLHE
jgi:ATP-dependent DNA helicase RecG